ncbi:MAG: hypothetical protein V7700_00835 [Halioglobus sp.]
MTTAQSLEYRITQQLLRRRGGQRRSVRPGVAVRVIRITAVTVAMVLLASFLQELLWVTLAGSTIATLGIKS